MPTVSREPFRILTRYCGVKLDHWFTTFNRCIRTSRDHDPRFDKALPGICSFQPVNTKSTWREEEIANRMRWLHRRDYSQLRKAWNVCRIHYLCVFDSPTWIANLSFRTRYRFQSRLILIENVAIGL